MPERLLRQSPLEEWPQPACLRGADVSITERPFRALLDLRFDRQDARVTTALAEATGLRVPQPNRFEADGMRALAWLGPNEFLLIGDPTEHAMLAAAVSGALAGTVSAVTDVTCGYTTLLVEGTGARTCLARGCPLDLHPRAFAAGHCAASHLAKANVLLLLRDPRPMFEIVVRRSFADYLWRWLGRGLSG